MLDLGLTGKIAIVTGGSEGMGRACAERLAREGAKVTICARRKDVLENAASAIRAAGCDVLAVPADVPALFTRMSTPPKRSMVARRTPSMRTSSAAGSVPFDH